MIRILALMASLLIAGCGPTANNITNSNINKLQVDMTREEVIAIMGNPEKREVHGRTEFLMYTTGNFTLTPIAIVDGRLLGWGRRYYDDTIKANATVPRAARRCPRGLPRRVRGRARARRHHRCDRGLRSQALARGQRAGWEGVGRTRRGLCLCHGNTPSCRGC